MRGREKYCPLLLLDNFLLTSNADLDDEDDEDADLDDNDFGGEKYSPLPLVDNFPLTFHGFSEHIPEEEGRIIVYSRSPK